MPSNAYENLPEGVEGRAFQEFRAADDDGDVLEGHAATFGDVYDVGPFREKIAPGAFDGVLDDDVLALRDHNPSLLLGRTTSGTLELEVDDTGLKSRIHLPDTADGDTVRTLVERGDLHHMSFAFEVEEDSWEKTPQGELRTIESVRKLYDVSPVSMPANPNTDVALRMRDAQREEREDEPEPVETITVRLDADVSDLRDKLEEMEALAKRIGETIPEPPEDRQSRPDFEDTEDIVPDWVNEGTWDRPDLTDHPEASEGDEFPDLPESDQNAIRGRFIEQGGDTYADLSNPVVNPDTDNLNRNGVLAARQRPASDEAEAIADALWEEHFEDEGESNAVDVGTLKRKLALEQAKVE